jgi:uncharacterized membrane protein
MSKIPQGIFLYFWGLTCTVYNFLWYNKNVNKDKNKKMTIINLLWTAAALAGILGIFVFIPAGIIFLVRASKLSEKDAMKKSLKEKGTIFILFPIMLIFGSIILVIISKVATALTGI